MARYSDIYDLDIKLMNMVKKEYGTDGTAWSLFYEFYEDPDGHPIENDDYKMADNIRCTADGLLSVKRIKCFEGFGDEFIDTFKKYRKTPIFFFPREKGGINSLRTTLLEDRIDHTLLDIKMYCEGKRDCILNSAYNLPKTKKWLEFFDCDFKVIVNWMKIKGIFVTDDYEIYDLEKSDDSTLDRLKKSYMHPKNRNYLSAWSNDYYDNVKKKIEKYELSK